MEEERQRLLTDISTLTAKDIEKITILFLTSHDLQWSGEEEHLHQTIAV